MRTSRKTRPVSITTQRRHTGHPCRRPRRPRSPVGRSPAAPCVPAMPLTASSFGTAETRRQPRRRTPWPAEQPVRELHWPISASQTTAHSETPLLSRGSAGFLGDRFRAAVPDRRGARAVACGCSGRGRCCAVAWRPHPAACFLAGPVSGRAARRQGRSSGGALHLDPGPPGPENPQLRGSSRTASRPLWWIRGR